MPRLRREISNSKLYHTIIKGIDAQDIFYDDQDRRFFLKQILKLKKEINYDILQSNVIARELRLIGYELISLFNGFDNYDKAVIPIIKIDDLKGIESIIK